MCLPLILYGVSCHAQVQEIVTNLRITNMEVREDSDKDVREYSYGRVVEKIVVRPVEHNMKTCAHLS